MFEKPRKGFLGAWDWAKEIGGEYWERSTRFRQGISHLQGYRRGVTGIAGSSFFAASSGLDFSHPFPLIASGLGAGVGAFGFIKLSYEHAARRDAPGWMSGREGKYRASQNAARLGMLDAGEYTEQYNSGAQDALDGLSKPISDHPQALKGWDDGRLERIQRGGAGVKIFASSCQDYLDAHSGEQSSGSELETTAKAEDLIATLTAAPNAPPETDLASTKAEPAVESPGDGTATDAVADPEHEQSSNIDDSDIGQESASEYKQSDLEYQAVETDSAVLGENELTKPAEEPGFDHDSQPPASTELAESSNIPNDADDPAGESQTSQGTVNAAQEKADSRTDESNLTQVSPEQQRKAVEVDDADEGGQPDTAADAEPKTEETTRESGPDVGERTDPAEVAAEESAPEAVDSGPKVVTSKTPEQSDANPNDTAVSETGTDASTDLPPEPAQTEDAQEPTSEASEQTPTPGMTESESAAPVLEASEVDEPAPAIEANSEAPESNSEPATAPESETKPEPAPEVEPIHEDDADDDTDMDTNW